MKKILVPIDFSKQAEYAAQVAAKIAKKTNSELHLLHALELPNSIIDPSSFGNADNSPATLLYMKKAQEKFEILTKRYFLKDIKISKSVIFHSAYDGIINESKEQGADLIVMGSQGVSGLEEMLVGSNTEKIVRHSDIPVLVVKNEIEDFELNNIVFASDFNEKDKSTFKKVVSFANIFEAKIHLLKVNTAYDFEPTVTSKSKIDFYLEDSEIKEHSINIYNDLYVEKGILNFARSIKSDLIALNTHGRKGLSNIFNGSVSEDISNHAVQPVVTFKIEE
ncbi:MAG: universal stress protein [Flavobacteriaceae bacterium]|nr:universal stress protein [Flavobacteriaceae bacterium]